MGRKKETEEERKLRLDWEKKLQAEGLSAALPPDGSIPSGLLDHRDEDLGRSSTFTTES